MDFKTKYQSCLSATEELQYIKVSDKAPSIFKENVPQEKKANYTLSDRKAVSSGKYLPINSTRLTGRGIDKNKKIYNALELNTKDAFTTFVKLKNWQSNRIFKKNDIIYDLLN